MEKRKRRLNPLYGIAAFVIIMLLFLFVFAPLQYYFGMLGLALTELGLLGATLLAVRLTGQSFRDVFPVRMPKIGQVVGTLMLWGGFFLLVMLVTLVLMYFFPEGLLDVSSSMNSVFSTVPAPVRFFIIAVMPAVCEEAVHRGVILSCMRPLKKTWLIVLVLGILFGLFHTSPFRFLPTAILGASITYIVVKTGNMVYGAIFHCVNNLVPLLAQHALLAQGEQQLADTYESLGSTAIPVASIGMYLAMAAVVPFGLYLGRDLLLRTPGTSRRFWPRGQETRMAMKILIPSLVIFGAGAILTAAGIFLFPDYFDLVRQARLSP